ncbi:MAG TPA: hypothetical protein PK772_06320 [Chitinophagaceae bacterium]|nr:hypothetical protein [Chitinophagaceae bacterium]
MNAKEIQRIAYITHIHEAAAKSDQINKMLILFYKKVYAVAAFNGIQFSTLQLPYPIDIDEPDDSSFTT